MRQIGPYVVREELARGGMGVVYRAHDPRAGRDVALKLLHGYEDHEPDELQRFQREAEAIAQIRHAGVVAVHDFGWEHGKPYLVMDLVQGDSLKQRLRRGALSQNEAARLMELVARALAAAHKVGVLHRDIKPENILIRSDTGEPVVADFGLAKVAGRQSLTASGTTLGTPAYMAPEQALARSEDVSERTDVYGLGATLYELLTGRAPFEGATAVALMARVIEEEPTPPRALRPQLDPGLEAIVLRCLAKDPAMRLPSAAALAEALAGFLRGESPRPSEARRSGPRRAWGVLLFLVLGASFLAGTLAWDSKPAPPGQAAPAQESPASVSKVTPPPASPASPEDDQHGSASEPSEPIPLAAYGWRRFGEGEFLRAKRAFERVLVLDPLSGRARRGLARVWLEWGDNVAGLEVLRDMRRGERDPEVLELQAELLMEEFQHGAALEACAQSVAIDPSRAQGIMMRGRIYAHMGMLDMALREFDQALLLPSAQRAPGLRARVLAWKAMALDRRSAKEALPVAAQALELDPESGDARYAHALASYHLNSMEQAMADLEHVLVGNPRNPRFRMLRGVCLLGMGQLEGALADFDEALELWPEYPAALANRALTLRVRARAPEATPATRARDLVASEEAARRAIASCGRFGPGYGELAETLAVKGDQEGRLRTLRRGASVLQFNAHVQISLAKALFQQGEALARELLTLAKTDRPAAEARYEALRPSLFEAKDALGRALESSPRRRDAYELLSQVAVLLQDPALELDALRRGVEQLPFDPRMWTALGDLQLHRKAWSDAAESFRRAVDLDPQSARSMHRRAQALTKLKRHEDAAALLRRATKLKPDVFAYWFELGQSLLELERFEEAVMPLARARKLSEKRREEVAFFLGEAFWGEGQPLKAVRQYEVYLTKGKAPARVKRARERLAEAERIRERRERRK